MPSLQILAAQISVPPTPDAAARDAHLDRLSGLLDEALTQERTDLVVLPELSSIDYSRESFDNLAELAEPLDGATFQALSPIASEHRCHILYGFPRIAGDRYRISHHLIGPDGARAGHFDKLHLAQYGASMEKEYFDEGEALFLFDVNGVKLAPIICYDIRFPGPHTRSVPDPRRPGGAPCRCLLHGRILLELVSLRGRARDREPGVPVEPEPRR